MQNENAPQTTDLMAYVEKALEAGQDPYNWVNPETGAAYTGWLAVEKRIAYEAARVQVARYIAVDATHRIEVLSNGHFYPQRVVNPQFLPGAYAWGYYRITRNVHKFYTTEAEARGYLARQIQLAAIGGSQRPL